MTSPQIDTRLREAAEDTRRAASRLAPARPDVTTLSGQTTRRNWTAVAAGVAVAFSATAVLAVAVDGRSSPPPSPEVVGNATVPATPEGEDAAPSSPSDDAVTGAEQARLEAEIVEIERRIAEIDRRIAEAERQQAEAPGDETGDRAEETAAVRAALEAERQALGERLGMLEAQLAEVGAAVEPPGEVAAVPDLVGLDRDTGRSQALEAGFTVVVRERETDVGADNGKVIAQSLEAGSEYSPEEHPRVVLFVGVAFAEDDGDSRDE